ncbi:endolytic transglycosylase MltG [Thermogemmatispora tikiterensis]|uniref:Endolytic murein transglycosylase n=1 Tax=Thermogemmatispora tikiterensis TaxID=1825093 RepID=A0A328VML2_9CHLR|nr:endolytic transglycosylase MltG [Thermogemmatispora tikiterensis]RAQ96354.1 hypothetical protein A4R35_12480 [Thermogemmatispora tikiterensis]
MKVRGPHPPRSRGAILSVFLVFALVLGLIYVSWNLVTAVLEPVSPPGQGHTVTIIVQENETVQQLANDLQAKGLIRNTLAFRFWAKIKGLDQHLQAGVYRNLNSSMNMSDIIDALMTGEPDEIAIRVPEGWRLEQIADKIEAAGLPRFSKQDFLTYTKNPAKFPDRNKFPFLKQLPSGATMEGLLFPDTYFFTLGATTTDVIDRLLEEFQAKVQQYHLDTQAAANHMSLYQMVILASIVEREAAFDSDRPLIASVYWNRVYRPNAETAGFLDADPTVQYARDSQPGTKSYWAPLAASGSQVLPDSPWNTYTHKGWPPTPICSPSLASLQAAASPAKTDYYFFLNRPDNGRAVFAKTQAEFDQEVQQYLK